MEKETPPINSADPAGGAPVQPGPEMPVNHNPHKGGGLRRGMNFKSPVFLVILVVFVLVGGYALIRSFADSQVTYNQQACIDPEWRYPQICP